MRVLLALALLAAACCTSLAAGSSPFRAALAAAGGCGAHRTLVEERLGQLSAASVSAVPQGEADLFGKPAGQWTEGEVRDALSAFKTCEIRSGPADIRQSERLARDLRGLDIALRRAIVVGHARAPIEPTKDQAHHGSDRGSVMAGAVRLRQGPAFTPASRGGVAAEGARPVMAPGDTPHAEGPQAVAVQSASPNEWDDAPPAQARHTQSSPADPALPVLRHSALTPVATPQLPTERTHCSVSRGAFELLQSEMRLSEVEGLLGCRGTIDGTVTISGVGTFETYFWPDHGSGATVTLVFQNKGLRSKAWRGAGMDVRRGG
ncbi:hypothetical protein [Methylobacterium sp. 17Sr1-1]|uniref:hypothetical protein n=1 Tax=Methylobacterium sp. 17Sr1-1 TaxID=2202826 RepID=UPI000D6F4312|nr:hypothetical protein [Methylobacterium sp. 17Sr1-1]AWN51122.1 hypothetical protein DK412_04880 [Methylobacterium sp. 17Sr1-1]